MTKKPPRGGTGVISATTPRNIYFPRKPPFIASMCWNGQTETAELIIDGVSFTGDPGAVKTAFDVLNSVCYRVAVLELSLLNIDDLLSEAKEYVPDSVRND